MDMLICRQSCLKKNGEISMRHLTQINASLKSFRFWLAIALVPMLSSCASPSRETALQPVNQYPKESDGTNLRTRGFLVTYTPTELHFNDKGARYYRHLGYYIYRDKLDQPFRYVPNYLSKTDEAATVVSLPAGYYLIKTQTIHGEPIDISISIRPAVTTTINLEYDSTPPAPRIGELYWVRFNGHRVGWIADGPAAWPGKPAAQ